MRYSYIKNYCLLVLVLSIISVESQSAFATTGNYRAFQQDVLKGKVTDEKGGALPGVNVMIKGEPVGTQTDSSGRFSINLKKKKNAILVFSYIGFYKKEVIVGFQTSFTVVLKEEATALDAVVVVGYGTTNRRDLTGSVSSVSAEDLKDVTVNSVAEALSGRLAGVQVTTSEGAPGAESDIVIRGGGSITQDNAPLYIIDGIQVENGLTGISPQDIQSIDVLKDASSTAIYGARGSNGVIIVTTKSGKDMKTAIKLNSFFGLNQLAKTLNVLDSYEFVAFQYERSRGSESEEISFTRNYGPDWAGLEKFRAKPAINWQDQMFGRNALSRTHSASITGGNRSTTFNISLTHNDQQGVMLRSEYKRNLLNVKLDHSVNANLKVGLSVRMSDQAIFGSGTSSAGQTQSSKLRQTIRYKPFITNDELDIDDFDESYFNDTNKDGAFLVNPISLVNSEYRKNNTSGVNVGGFLNYSFNHAFSFRSTIGLDKSIVQYDTFDDIRTPASFARGQGLPLVGIINSDKSSLNFSNVITYTNAKNNSAFSRNNKFNAILGEETYEVGLRQNNNQLVGFPVGITYDKALGQTNLGTIMTGFPKATDINSRILSFFSRLNYAYKDKYLASVTVRADGSSKFAPGNRWGYFPSGSLAWRISKESFMKKYSFISDMKLRASYGQAGNNRIGDFLYLPSYITNEYPYSLNEELIASYSTSSLANSDLKWERTISRNMGLDLAFFRSKLVVNIDVYQNDVKDLLINVPIPGSSGYSKQLQNVGTTRNRGLEFQLSAPVITNKNFNWKTSFNVSFNRNIIKALSTYQDFYFQNSGWGIAGQLADYIVQVGKPVGSMYGFVTDGYYALDDFSYDPATKIYSLKAGVPTNVAVAGIPQPGAIKFKDLNGDGIVNADNDRAVIGNANPKFSGGVNQQFRYKNFDMSIFANFVYGNKVLNANKIEFSNGYLRDNNLLSVMQNRWRSINNAGDVLQYVGSVGGQQVVFGESPEKLAVANKDASIWQVMEGSGAFTLHSWAVEDGSFLRINNITFGYTLPSKLSSRMKINALRFYATLNNVALITNYSGYDPEVNVARSTPVTPGLDYSAYPRSKGYLFGLNVTF